MTAFYLGPLGRMRAVPLVQRGAAGQVSRASSTFETLGGRRYVQRAPRGPRDWGLSLGERRDPSVVAHLVACASGALPGPLYLYAMDAALTNLLPADVAAPCQAGTVALGSVAGSVAVGMPSGVELLTGVAQQATVGAWSVVVPVRASTGYVLSGWSSAAGAAVEWRVVSAGGVPVSSGTLSTVAVDGGFYGAVSIVPGATVAGIQVRLSSGSRTVGGLRLVEGALPEDGVEVRRNLASDPRATVSGGIPSGHARWTPRWFGTGGAGTTTVVAGATDGPEVAPGVRIPTHLRKEWTTGGAVAETGFDHTIGSYSSAASFTAGMPVTAGATYTFTSYMRASRSPGTGATFAMRVTFRDAAGARILPAPVHTSAPIVAGAWVRVSTTATAPVGAVTVSGGSDVLGTGSWLAGDTLDGTGLLIEQASSLGAYFDGSTSPDPALLPSWTGTPNASPSILKTVPVDAVWPGWAPGRGVPQVVVDDPTETLQLVTSREVLADYSVTIREVG